MAKDGMRFEGQTLDSVVNEVSDTILAASIAGIADIMDTVAAELSTNQVRQTSNLPPKPPKWTVRTGRLLRSYLKKVSFIRYPGAIKGKIKRAVEGKIIRPERGILQQVSSAGIGVGEGIREVDTSQLASTGVIIGYMGSKTPYASRLEYGTTTKSKISRGLASGFVRRFSRYQALAPAINETQSKFDDIIAKRFSMALRKLGWRG